MRHLWIPSLTLALPLLLWGCPAEPAGDDDDTLGDDDDAAADDVVSDDATGDDDDFTPHPDAPVISNFQIWVDIPLGETQELVLFLVEHTDPQGGLFRIPVGRYLSGRIGSSSSVGVVERG
jgi:hypothetical protein